MLFGDADATAAAFDLNLRILRLDGMGDLPDALPEYLQALSGKPQVPAFYRADPGSGA